LHEILNGIGQDAEQAAADDGDGGSDEIEDDDNIVRSTNSHGLD
jgi:hypothetical protein